MPAKGHDLPKAIPATKSELAQHLRVSVRSLQSWGKLPGAPTGLDVEEWKKFADENQLGIAGNRVGGSREELLQEKLRSEIRLNELKIQKEEGKTVLVSEVEERDLHLATLQKTVLYQKLGRELGARCAGRSAEELCVLGEQIADEICGIFSEGVEKWKDSLTA